MKRVMIILVSILLSLSMVFGLIGCSKNEKTVEETKKTEAATTEKVTEKDSFKEHFEISWQGYNTTDLADDNWVQKQIEKKFNVTIKNNHGLDYVDIEKQKLLIATGEVPDVYFSPFFPEVIFKEGVVRTIPENMIKEFAPLMYSELEKNQPALRQWRDKTTGEFQALTTITLQPGQMSIYPFIRLDWLENVGMKPKWEMKEIADRLYWSSESFTLEEFEKVLDAFTNKDPDKNGKNDTFGHCLHPDSNYAWDIILEAFGGGGSWPYKNTKVDGKAMDVAMAPYYKEFLKMMQRWYKNGYVDKEWLTNNIPKSFEKFTNGIAGSFFSNANFAFIDESWMSTWPPRALFDKDPNAKVLIYAPFKGPDGKQGTRKWLPVSNCGNYFNYVSKKVSDEKLIRILQIYDYVNFNDEGHIMANYGEEGTHWKWKGEPFNSKIILNTGVEYYKSTGIKSYTNDTNTLRQNIWRSNPITLPIAKFEQDNPGIITDNYTHDLFGEFSSEITALKEKYGSVLEGGALQTIVNEFRANAFTGKTDIDAEWDSYVKKLLDNGMKEWNELFNKFPKSSDLKDGK